MLNYFFDGWNLADVSKEFYLRTPEGKFNCNRVDI